MDGAQVQTAVELVNAACDRIAQLRRKRIGDKSAKQLAEELALVNRMMRAGDASQQGNALAQKALWFNHDHLLNELGNLDTLVQTLKGMLADEQVRQEIANEGFSLDKTLRHVQTASDWIEQFRANVAAHEAILAGGLTGSSVSVKDMDMLEDRLVRYNDWEQKVVVLGKSAVARIKQHPGYTTLPRQQPSLVKRIAAALVLGIASTVFSASGLYAQENASQGVAKVAFENKEVNLSDKNIDDLLKYDSVEKVLDENVIIPGAKVMYVKQDGDKSDFGAILSSAKEAGAIIVLYENHATQDLSKKDALIAKITGVQFGLPIIAYNASSENTAKDLGQYVGKTKLSIPSVLLASKKDVVTGKEQDTLQIIDIVRAAPTKSSDVSVWIKNFSKYWIPTNITGPNGEFAWRSQNSEGNKWIKVAYQK